MKLASFQLDRFGARSNLNLTDISGQLNVIYGPNGAGKTTLIQFIRWMMFGQADDISRRYLDRSGSPAKGSMTISDSSGTRTLYRACQAGSLLSHLTTEGGTEFADSAPIGISSSEFDLFYTISFDQHRDVSELLNSARLHGFQIHVDQRQLDRIRQLTEQINDLRIELGRFSQSEPVEALRSRLQEKRCELDSIRLQWQLRHDELDCTRLQLNSEVSEQQMLTDRLHRVLENIDLAIDGRQRQLTDEHRHWVSAWHEAEVRRDRRAQELDGRSNRWQEILTEVRVRLEQVRSRITALGDFSFSATEATDLHFFMRKLGFRIRDVEQDLSEVYDTETSRDYEADVEYLRGLLGSAVTTMQREIMHLGQTVERQQQVNELHGWREELTYLCRVEKELTDLTDALGRQRHQLEREAEYPPQIGVPDATDQDGTSKPELATLLDDFRLRHLIGRRESATARMNEAEMELTDRNRQVREIEEELARHDRDTRSKTIEREIIDIEEQLRICQQRILQERRVASLEEELRYMRENSGRSEFVDEAAFILQRLTNNQYCSIRVSESHECQISRTGNWQDGQTYAYSQLSRGVQDQVYLALSIAIVSAYRRKGTVTPLILNDVFVNLDQSGMNSLAAVLREFSSQDQVLVFTRHEHVRELFTATEAKHFRLSKVETVPQKVLTTAREAQTYETPSLPQPVADLAPAPQDPTYQWVAEWQRRDPVHPVPEPAPAPLPDPPEKPEQDRPAATLPLESALSDTAILSEDLVNCLAEIGIKTVQEFIELDPEALEEQLGDHGITAEIVQRRQREVLMIVYLNVSVLDAQLLVACGVPDPDRLSRADEAVLLKRVETILERPQAAQRFGARSKYNLARIRGWIEAAKQSRYRSRRSGASNGSRRPPKPSSDLLESRTPSPSSSERATVKMSSDSLRFYLELNDPVVDAPSIGPRTAEKLSEIDIYTIANLLDADAEQVAAQLNDRRITSDTVAQWQLQSQLVCRIPNLRGHDAQILVACGVEDPVTLSSMDASSFLKQVTKFVNTKDGQRVVRSGKKPDLAEVTAWIEWSESARQLRAA